MPKSKPPSSRNALACGPEQGPKELQLKGRIWLEKEGKTFISWGRAVLLQRIAQEGSLSAAARSMGMSYSHAWNLVEEMNCLAGEVLVEKQTGGKSGGSAHLTPAGERAVATFWELVKEFQSWVDGRKIS
jgi:molybdate transport system regulatory protein